MRRYFLLFNFSAIKKRVTVIGRTFFIIKFQERKILLHKTNSNSSQRTWEKRLYKALVGSFEYHDLWREHDKQNRTRDKVTFRYVFYPARQIQQKKRQKKSLCWYIMFMWWKIARLTFWSHSMCARVDTIRSLPKCWIPSNTYKRMRMCARLCLHSSRDTFGVNAHTTSTAQQLGKSE